MALSEITKITGAGIATDTNWVGNNANFTGITTAATSFNIGITTIHSTLIEAHNIKSTGIITATGGSFSGNVTAVDGTFSGNVSIAGTLTYEDVTNIDSVGVITARSNIDCNGSLDVDGHTNLDNVSIAGVTTITKGASGGATANTDASLILHNNNNNYIQILSPNNKEQGLLFGDDADNDAGNIIYDHSDNALTFATNGGTNERLRIASDGKIGINQNTPTADLEIVGVAGTITTLFLNSATHNASVANESILKFGFNHSGSPDAVGYVKLIETSGNIFDGDMLFGVPYNTGSGGSATREALRIKSSGRVGINSTNPSAPLEIYTAASAAWKFRIDTTVSDGVGFYQRVNGDFELVLRDASNNVNYIAGTSGALQFATSGSERLRIDSNGNMGLGTQLASDAGSAGAGLKIEKYVHRNNIYAFPDGYYAASLGEVNNTQTKVWASVDSHYARSSAVSAGLFLSAFHQDTGGSGCGSAIKNLKTGNALTFSTVTTGASVGSVAVETERLRITSDGKVGVGDFTSGTSVSQALHVKGSEPKIYLEHTGGYDMTLTTSDGAGNNGITVNGGALSLAYNNKNIWMCRTGGYVSIGHMSPQQKLHLHEASSNGNFMQFTNSTTGATGNDGVLFGINSDEGGTIWNQENTYIRFGTNDTERLRIDSTGRIQIGSTNSVSRNNFDGIGLLNLQNNNNDGVVDYTQGIVFTNNNSNEGTWTHAAIVTTGSTGYDGNLIFATDGSGARDNSASNLTERLRITSTGQLLQGETSAFDSNTAIQFRKDVSGNEARFIFRNRANNSSSRVQLQLSTLNRAANADVSSGIEKYQNGGMAIYNGENTNQYSNINFFTNGWRSLQLRNGNHSGAWCAEIDAYWGTSNGLRMEVGGPQSGTWQAIDFHTSHTGTQRGYIGVTYGGVSYNSSSDYRMKQNVVDLTSAIDRVKSLKPKRFRWKEDLTHTVDGFLAHEAQTVVPESVQGEKDGEQMQVMDNSKLVPVLTAALKEAIAKIETLETKVAALEGS